MDAGRTTLLPKKERPTTVDEFLADFRRRILELPPNSKILAHVATNGNGEFHNNRFELMEDHGRLSRN